MTLLKALNLVRNMAYELTDQGRILHDLPVPDNEGLDYQTHAIDIVDAWVFDTFNEDHKED